MEYDDESLKLFIKQCQVTAMAGIIFRVDNSASTALIYCVEILWDEMYVTANKTNRGVRVGIVSYFILKIGFIKTLARNEQTNTAAKTIIFVVLVVSCWRLELLYLLAPLCCWRSDKYNRVSALRIQQDNKFKHKLTFFRGGR